MIVDRSRLHACEGELASLLAEVNRDCLGSAFDKSPERQARAAQLFNLLGDRAQALKLLAALGGLCWPTTRSPRSCAVPRKALPYLVVPRPSCGRCTTWRSSALLRLQLGLGGISTSPAARVDTDDSCGRCNTRRS